MNTPNLIGVVPRELWFVTGSQHLYGPATLEKVAANSLEIAGALDRSPALPAKVVFKSVLTTPDAIAQLCREANDAPQCAGLICWMHTFSPAKMWIGGLTALVLLGLLLKPQVAAVPTPFLPINGSPALPFLTALLVVQTGSLFSADAWNSITFIAGEVKEPRRTIPMSLLIGPALVCTLYLLANFAYLKVLGPTGIASAPQDRVGSAALQALLGPGGGLIMAGAILVSMFGCLNGLVISGARVYQRMAVDGLFHPRAASLNARGVPAFGIWSQALWACLLALTGTYGQLLDFVMLPTILFYVFTVGGVFLLRWRRPGLERPVRVWGYPVVPALYLLGSSAIVGALVIHRPSYSWPGLILVALGWPVYLALKPRLKK